MEDNIITDSKNREILYLLSSGKFSDVIKLTNKKGFRIKYLLRLGKRKTGNKGFSCDILNSCLRHRLKPNSYTRTRDISFNDEFIEELNELVRILLVLEDYKGATDYEKTLSLTILECVKDGAIFIEQNSGDYPMSSINAKIWMDGAGLRVKAEELSYYFNRKRDSNSELDSLFLKAKLTNTVMSHYPNLVGPDMIAVGNKLEHIGSAEKAMQFYKPVELDFTDLVQDIQDKIDNHKSEIGENDVIIIKSLTDALEGLKRLGEQVDENKLINSKQVLIKVEEIVAANMN